MHHVSVRNKWALWLLVTLVCACGKKRDEDDTPKPPPGDPAPKPQPETPPPTKADAVVTEIARLDAIPGVPPRGSLYTNHRVLFDDTHLYVLCGTSGKPDASFMARLPIAGGDWQVVGKIPVVHESATIVGGALHWIDSNKIGTMPLTGGTPTYTTWKETSQDFTIVDGAYWGSQQGAIVKVPFGASAPIVLTKHARYASDVTLDGDDIFWMHRRVDGGEDLMRMKKSSGTPEMIATHRDLEAFAVASDRVYWSEESSISGGASDFPGKQSDGAVHVVSRTAPGHDKVLAGRIRGPEWIVVHGDYAYWPADGGLWQAKHDGSVVRVLAIPEKSRVPLYQHRAPTTHASGLYWIEDGVILKIVPPQ